MMLSIINYRFMKTIWENIVENRDYFYMLNQCLSFSEETFLDEELQECAINEARKEVPPWRSDRKAFIANPSPEAIARHAANPYKMVGDKKQKKNPPRTGFQGTLLHGIDNAKIAKSWKKGIISLILNLSPAEESGFNLCSCSTKGCALACLHLSGSPVYQKAKMQHRLGNTFYLVKERQKFIEQLASEIKMAKEYADSLGKKLAIRLNGTSDLPWESPEFGLDGKNIFQMFPDVQFYDYTKLANRAMKFVKGDYAKEGMDNYHLTFSYSERPSSIEHALKILKEGGNVAIVFGPGKTAAREGMILPKVWNGFKVVDGDESDLRFEDEKGVVVGLTAKADAAWDFDKLSEKTLGQISQVLQGAGVKVITSKNKSLSPEAIRALAHPQVVGQIIDILRHGPKPENHSHRASGFVIPPEHPSVDPRTYPDNMPYAIHGLQKKLSRSFAGKDKREVYQQMRQQYFSQHSSLYSDYLARIEKYCKEHPEECKDTHNKHLPIAKPDNPLSQSGIGIAPEKLQQIGILPKGRDGR